MVHYTYSFVLCVAFCDQEMSECKSIGYARQDVQEKYVTFIIWYEF